MTIGQIGQSPGRTITVETKSFERSSFSNAINAEIVLSGSFPKRNLAIVPERRMIDYLTTGNLTRRGSGRLRVYSWR